MPFKKRSKLPETDRLSQARLSLHVNNCPETIPCREEEFENVQYILESAIVEQKGACLYISGTRVSIVLSQGVPGSGKTATVSSVIRNLEADENVPGILLKILPLVDFDYHVINANKLASPASAVTMLYKYLTGRGDAYVTDSVAAARIQTVLDNLTRPAIVFIGNLTFSYNEIDELDQLMGPTAKSLGQRIIYNFFEWPCQPKSLLITIAVANTMDLPERVMLNKIGSRIGLTRQNFTAYTHEELIVILESLLVGLNVFESDAVTYIARKVAAVSGDARKALV
jgi:Cdc6-like AAA superfamily ATPase